MADDIEFIEEIKPLTQEQWDKLKKKPTNLTQEQWNTLRLGSFECLPESDYDITKRRPKSLFELEGLDNDTRTKTEK